MDFTLFYNPLVILALAVGFYMAWNIGANDVANAFGCSVGSGALTFRKALFLAAIFEFCGAFFAGTHVADTIRGNIVIPEAFALSPREFAIGMLAALLAASLWLNVATFLSQPVSTTHAIIGAVIGFGLAAHGFGCIRWSKLVSIASSWFISPVCGSFLAFLLYLSIRKLIMRNDDPVARAKIIVPIAFGTCIGILLYSIFKMLIHRMFPSFTSSNIAAVTISVLTGVLFWLIARLFLKNRNPAGADIHEKYATVERWFARLQIITACYMSFAHGANDVANAIGPIAGILHGLQGNIVTKTAIPPWILAFGGAGIVVGLATYGYKVIEAVGRKITEVTPTRGFSAEFATATTVLVCSLAGWPISTTFVLVGAVMGVGLARGFGTIDLSVVRRIFASWLITIPVSAAAAAGIYLCLKRLV